MKFRFCGDGDCPDWVLAEIYSSLSVLSSVKLKILTQMVAKSLLGEFIPDEKLRETFAANKPDLTSIKSSFACIRFLIVNAIRFNTDDATFNEELQQLGLPKEHSSAVCRVMSDHYQALKQHLIDTSLKVNELESISCTIPNDVIDCAQLTFDIANEIVDGIPTKQSHKVNISKLDIGILLNEMRTVRNLMDEMNYEERYNGLQTG
ncbi:COMM domain-containing protein 4 [Bradysia coprophila]|uniref:COMM domain-containing protein 4 n=1 Tax=Bradysia coprophila TaxID=38358 RepID=UPI00187D7F09|nr:COMM domain-containing protein 4 [Bradysia coprophila]